MVSLWLLLPLAYVVCGFSPLAIVPYVGNHRGKPGSAGMVTAAFGFAVWAVGLALLVIGVRSTAPTTALLAAATMAMLGSQLTAGGYALLAGEYTGRLAVTRRRLAGFAVVLVVLQLLAVTDPVHGLTFGDSSQPLYNQAALGPVGLGVILLTLVTAFVGVAVLAYEMLTTSGVRRTQSGALAFVGLTTVGVFLFDIYALAAVPYPLFPIGFVLPALAMAWVVFRGDFLDVVPIAHRRIVEEMDDAAIIVDGTDRVVECNPAARRLAGADGDYAGVPVADLFEETPELRDRLEGRRGVDTEITVTVDEATRYFHLNVSRIDHAGPVSVQGRLIVLRDVTTLKEREAELEFLRRVQARVLRHNLRNDLTVIRGYASLLADESDGSDAYADAIDEKSDELLSLSKKARTIGRVIDRERVVESIDLSTTLSGLVASVREAHPHASISLSAPDHVVVEADRWLESAFEILVENAVEHNDGPRPTVGVAVERTAEEATVTVTDDGPGIPPDELEVLERGEETQLEHASGIGLWIVHWIVRRSRASISFDTGDDGTRVTIQIPY